MAKAREGLVLVGICLLVILLSAAGIAAAFLQKIALNIDGILLLGVCLMMGGLFTLMLFLIAREQGWLPAMRKKESSAPAAASGAKPAAQEAK